MSVTVNLETHDIVVEVDYQEKGDQGFTPYIGINENWWINGEDTGLPSRGIEGESPEITIGENDNWFIDGVDTGVKAKGEKGDPIMDQNTTTGVGEIKFWTGTRAEYDVIASPSSDIIYHIRNV